MPRHDLTATEERLIEYLREGLHDAEIAVRIGLPIADVKARITQVLQRHRLVDRDALLSWYVEEPVPESPPLPPNQREREWVPVVAVVAVVAIGVTLVIAAAMVRSGSPEGSALDDADATARVSALQTAVAGRDESPQRVLYREIGGSPKHLAFFRIVDRTTWAIENRDLGALHVLEPPPSDEPFGFHFDETSGRLAYIAEVRTSNGAREFHLATVIPGSGELPTVVSLPEGHPPRFFADGQVVIGPGYATPRGWRLLDPSTGALQPIEPPAEAIAPPIGWIPGSSFAWPADEGRVVDSAGNTLFALEADGRVPDAIDSFVYNPFSNLDASTIDDEADDSGVVRLASEGMAAVGWRAGEDAYVSVVSLAERRALFTHHARFTPVSPAWMGFAGNNCFAFGRCTAAVLGIDGLVRLYPDFGPIVGAMPGPFALVRESACAVVHDSLSEGLSGPCQPPDALLRLFVGSELGDRWVVQTRVAGDTEYVRLIQPDGSTGWVAADSVVYADEYLLGGVDFRR